VEIYGNLNGDSGVKGYVFGPESISVHFRDASVYTYSYASAGQQNIVHMKVLAAAGRGLNAFINTTVKTRYESKQR
jgi:hypothetical protein